MASVEKEALGTTIALHSQPHLISDSHTNTQHLLSNPDTTSTNMPSPLSDSPGTSVKASISREGSILPADDTKSPLVNCTPITTTPSAPPLAYGVDRADGDIEAGRGPCHLYPTDCADKIHANDPAVWPSKALLKEKCRRAKAARSCNPMRNLPKRQRLLAKIGIALLIVGAAVTIGIGISLAVGGRVYKGEGRKGEIQ